MDVFSGRARGRVLRLLASLLGALLVVPVVAVGPAAAAARPGDGLVGTDLADLTLVDITPQISGAGSVVSGTLGVSYLCDNASGTEAVTVVCSQVSGLAGVTGLVLTAVPAPGWELVGWTGTGCTSVTAGDCVIDASLLSSILTPLAPVATFVPIEDPDPCATVPLPTCDTIAPVTKITKSPVTVSPAGTGGRTKEKTATFEFKAYEPDGSGAATTTETPNATFECQLTGPGQTAGFTACTTPKTYSNLTDGQYTFSVRALDDASTPNVDATPETFGWTVDTTAPETTLLSGPSTWVLGKSAAYTYKSSESSSSFACFVDDFGRPCGVGSATVGFPAGTHTFEVQATDVVGNKDATPAARTSTRPLNNTDLSHKGFTKAKGSGYFLKTYSVSKRKGAALSTYAAEVKRLALVVTKGKGFGVVKVYLGKKLLKKVSLAARTTRKKQVVNVASFSTARKGKVRVVVASSGKKVVVEGLGIASR